MPLFTELPRAKAFWETKPHGLGYLLGEMVVEGHVTGDLNDGSDEVNDRACGRSYGLYEQTRRLFLPLLRPTECRSGSPVDRLGFGLGAAFRALP